MKKVRTLFAAIKVKLEVIMNAMIKRTAIYNRALSADEIKKHYEEHGKKFGKSSLLVQEDKEEGKILLQYFL